MKKDKKIIFKLSYKVFAVFFAAALLIILLFIGSLQKIAKRNFEIFTDKVEGRKLDNMVRELSSEYKNSKGWSKLKNSPGLWRYYNRPLDPFFAKEQGLPPPSHPPMPSGL